MAAQARLSLFMSKYHIVGNHMNLRSSMAALLVLLSDFASDKEVDIPGNRGWSNLDSRFRIYPWLHAKDSETDK